MPTFDQELSHIQVGDLDVLETGFVTSPGNKPITITLAEEMVVEFRFDYESDEEPSYNSKVIDDKLVVTLKNFAAGVVMGGSTPPIGVLEPVLIGELLGRELLLLFQVRTSKGENSIANSTLFYNFYLGEPVEGESDVEE